MLTLTFRNPTNFFESYISTYSDYTATTAEWTSILKIACEYDFVEVKNCAIRGLQQCDLSLIERLRVYEMYKVGPIHLAPLYGDICARDRGLDDGEIKMLGPESSLRIFRLRERVRSSEKNRSPLPEGVDALDAVCKILKVDRTKIPSTLTHRTGYGSVIITSISRSLVIEFISYRFVDDTTPQRRLSRQRRLRERLGGMSTSTAITSASSRVTQLFLVM